MSADSFVKGLYLFPIVVISYLNIIIPFLALFYYSYRLVTFALRFCLKCRLAPCSYCWNILRIKFPIKIKKFLKKYFIDKILNFLKNRSRPFVDTDYGPLDRELKEDEDLLNSEKRKVSASVYVPLGLYVVIAVMITFIMSLRSFIVNPKSVPKMFTLCYDVNETNCINYTYSSIELSPHYNVDSALMTFGGVTVAYYLSLRVLSLLFQYCYRITRVLRHFLIILDSTAISIETIFLSIHYSNFVKSVTIFPPNDMTVELILYGLFSALMIPWEEVYTVQHMMNSQRNSRLCLRNKSSFKESSTSDDDNSGDRTNLELEDNRNRNGSITAVDMEEENDIAAVVVIEMEEEGVELNSSYHAL